MSNVLPTVMETTEINEFKNVSSELIQLHKGSKKESIMPQKSAGDTNNSYGSSGLSLISTKGRYDIFDCIDNLCGLYLRINIKNPNT